MNKTYYFRRFLRHEFYYHMMLENYLRHCKDNLSCYHHVLIHNQHYNEIKKNKNIIDNKELLVFFFRTFAATLTATTGDGTHREAF